MIRTVTLPLIVVAISYGAVCQFREEPSTGSVLLSHAETGKLSFDWPPRVGAEYPDLELVDQTGRMTRLSEFRSKVLLVELVGISCGACQAFAGAHEVGVFQGGKLQRNLESIETYARRYGRFDLNDEGVVYVQLLLFNEAIQAPSADQAHAWAEHFGMQRSRNQIVLTGTTALATRESYGMVPGFHLIDRDFVLHRDSSGHRPIHNLYDDLLPTMGRLVVSSR